MTLVAIFSLVPLQEKEKKRKRKKQKKCYLNVNSYHFKCTWIYLSRAGSCVIFLDLPVTGRPAQSHLKKQTKKKTSERRQIRLISRLAVGAPPPL